MVSRPRRVALVVAVAALVAGCGSSSSSSTTDPSSVVKQFFDAAAKGDGKTACSLLTSSVQNQVATGGPCEKEMSQFGAALKPQLKGLQVGSAKVNGDTATVIAKTSAHTATLTLQRSGSSWVISKLSG